MKNAMTGEYPRGWTRTTLGEVAHVSGGTTPSRSEPRYWTNGTIAWASPTDVTALDGAIFISETSEQVTQDGVDESSLTILPPGAVLMTSRATIGEAVVTTVPITTNQGFCSFLPSPGVSSVFLAYWLRAHKPRFESLGAGSTFLEVSKSSVRKVGIWLPPLAEQQKIAEILGSVDDAIAATKAVIEQTKQVKKGVLQDLLTRGIGHTKFKQTAIGEIPDSWSVVNFLDVLEIASGQVDPRDERYLNTPLIAPNHIESGTGRLLGLSTVEEQKAISGKYVVQPGDVVYSKIRPYLQKVWLADRESLCSADMYPLRPTDRIVPRFAALILLSYPFTEFATSMSARTGIPKINREELAAYNFALPGYEEQREIADLAGYIDELTIEEQRRLRLLHILKKGLSQELLSGERRVV